MHCVEVCTDVVLSVTLAQDIINSLYMYCTCTVSHAYLHGMIYQLQSVPSTTSLIPWLQLVCTPEHTSARVWSHAYAKFRSTGIHETLHNVWLCTANWGARCRKGQQARDSSHRPLEAQQTYCIPSQRSPRLWTVLAWDWDSPAPLLHSSLLLVSP